MGFTIIFCWLIVALTLTLLGSKSHNNVLLGVGTVMLLMMSMIAGVSY